MNTRSYRLQAIGGALLVIAMGAAVVPLVHRSPAQAVSPTATPVDPAAEIAALRKEIEILKGKVPDQSHAMKDVAYHFTNLWFAGQNENWPLAKFYCDETRAHLKWAVRIIPVRKVKAGELDLKPILDGIDQSLFAPLHDTITAGNKASFTEAYRQALGRCYSCHVAAEKPFLRLHVPEQPEVQVVDFTRGN
jgi:hypothetical protein